MAPPPEYDKEPKAPDKSVTINLTEDSKLVYNHIKDQSANTEHKTASAGFNVDVENNKHVEILDDVQLRALLDEAITYKCPKDREGKSSLFKELLEEVEQDEQACEAAARLGAGRNARRGRARREHHSSLQDLVAAMAGEAAPRRGRAHAHSHAPAPPAGNVSARALHGGSLPSGVDTSFLLGEESGVGVGGSRGGYLATVRCVNPPPLAERRVSTGDANPPQQQSQSQPVQELDVLTRRSKPMFPMTYTARATLEIGSGSVCSGRAVTTTTASNQVRTAPSDPRTRNTPKHLSNQAKLMNALYVPMKTAPVGGGATGGLINEHRVRSRRKHEVSTGGPRGPASTIRKQSENSNQNKTEENNSNQNNTIWVNTINNWYESLDRYSYLATTISENANNVVKEMIGFNKNLSSQCNINIFDNNIQNFKSTVTTHPTNCNSIVVKSIKTCKSNKFNSTVGYKRLSLKDTSIDIDKVKCDNNEDKVDDLKDNESDISLRRQYRERVGYNLVAPAKLIESPRNIRSLTVGKSQCITNERNKREKKCIKELPKNTKKYINEKRLNKVNPKLNSKKTVQISNLGKDSLPPEFETPSSSAGVVEDDCSLNVEITNKSDAVKKSETITEFELDDFSFNSKATDESSSFVKYVAKQKELIKKMEINNNEDDPTSPRIKKDIANEHSTLCTEEEAACKIKFLKVDKKKKTVTNESQMDIVQVTTQSKNDASNTSSNQLVMADLPNNAYILLTFPQSFLKNPYTTNEPSKVKEIVSEINSTNAAIDCNENKPIKKKKNKPKQPVASDNVKKEGMNKKALKMLLYSDSPEKTNCIKKKLSSYKDNEVDSAIPFSCITTPEVVASCNTTSSTSQSAVAVDPKPLQLVSSYRAVACLMDGAFPPRPPSPPPPNALPAALAHPTSPVQQPRGVISSSFNGLPLSRPSASDEYKVPILTVHYRLQKSLDENGNAVQGFGSPLSGSSQQKKPRRKKSSKNETVIKSHQIDGYQGNKDINEVLRFIESNAEGARAPKLRAKHKDDSDDKAGKKRSTERRKDKESKPKRASSLEELSRTKLEDLTDKQPRAPPAKPERRSWGEDARSLLEPDPPPELADFQTQTIFNKKNTMVTHISNVYFAAWEDVMRGGGKVHYFSECVARNN
ncbi:jg5067 [Pararge aegeria aegeria]|uniref:Jg5067 protein n=1 Tax=Pararge aegeria aegeria TaxID=348720 RepID=A0A8S4R4Z2_9NEOP|nr:jg5067 [Pararge aegeria aegeria]